MMYSKEKILQKIANKKHKHISKKGGDKLINLWLNEIAECLDGEKK